jgi:Fur family ferric uptake transcriptional regulator
MSRPPFQRLTRQREVILEEVRKLDCHPTAAEVYRRVRRRLPRISLATVYRNLDLLAEMGAIERLALGGSEARFDGDLKRHDHVQCVRCGRLDDVSGPPFELAELPGADPHGYQILGYRLQYLGLCPCCSRKERLQESQ